MPDHEHDPLHASAPYSAANESARRRWQRIKELLLDAEALDPSNRDEFLRQACGSDKALRAEIESLLEADPSAVESSFSTANVMQMAGVSAAAAAPMIGHRVGAYEIVRLIGQGGMAVVYLAARADDAYRKQVAVKLVRSGLDNAEVLSRFSNERQTLASLDHSSIVRLIDGGSTAEGVPYLVMDYVEGVPIDEYCDTHRFSTEQRVRLFCTVCDAVQYAHQKLVVHRDLKPSNILVTADGAPKLLDFGISKVLTPGVSVSSPLLTQTSARRMTPAYASPEQVRGRAVTLASDIYSLGVVLYELLTGHRPYRLKERTPAELEQAICEQEAENPSTAVDRVETETSPDGTTVSKTPEQVSHTREGEPEKLRRRLRGDLDNIVLMALRKEPQRRYASAQQLLEDIQRHLDHRPVKARPSTIAYRASKFVRRRRTEVAAAGLVVVLILAAAVALSRAPLREPKVKRFIQITNDGRQKNGADFMLLIPSPYVSDGKNLFFSEMIDGQLALAQVPVAGGEPVPISTPWRGVAIGDLSLVRSEFLLFRFVGDDMEWPVWKMSVAGGPVQRVGKILATSATWSPDGKRVLYTLGHGVYICQPDGSEVQKVVETPGLPILPRLSPNGDIVRFTQYDPRNSTSALWQVSLNGTGLRPLLPTWTSTSSCCGDWMANGKYFVFRSHFDIWIMRESERRLRESNRPVQLTAGPLDYYNLAVSKDGRTLFVMGRQRRGELQRFDAQRSEFVPYLNGISAQVSVSGERLAYATVPEQTLWSSRIDGGERLQLTFPPLMVEFPRISPDGQRVTFMASLPRGARHVYTVSIHGGDVQQLSFGEAPQAYPDWSPDGKQLAFSGLEAFSAGKSATTPIQILDLSTHRTILLLGSDGLICPHWSPDGRYLAAKSADSLRLMLYDLRSHRWLTLATSLSVSYLNWSHNGKYIYFNTVAGDTSEAAFYRLHVSDRRIDRIADLKMRQVPAIDYWNGLAPDDSPLIFRDIGSQEIYTLDLELP